MKNKPRVLFVGRDASDAALLDVVFERDAPDCEVVHVGDPITFGREIERADFDLVVCEDGLEWIGGPGVLVEVRARRPSATVVVLTTHGDASLEADLRRREVVLPKTSASFLELPALLRAALDRAAIEASVTRLEPRIRGLLEKSRVGVFRCTLNGRLLDADETFLSILGAATVEQARALDLGELTPQLPRGFTETGKVYKREERLQTATGEPLWAAVTEIVNLDEQGMPVLDGLLEDISERKGVESDLSVEASKLARSNEDLRMFASLAAHELKEPLRTIEQSTKILLEDGQGQRSDDAKQSADLIVGGVKRLQSMIEGLLTLARFGGGSEWVEACDCNELMDEVLDGLKAPIDESGAEVVVKALPTVHADPLQLRLVFRNLVANAVKYSGDAPPRIEVSARQDEEEWVFSVQDEGVGIAPESSERIFDQFARGDEGSGAGLGLAICRQVVERHGGRIWVDSEKGKGATFFFTIPLSSGIRGSDRRDDDGGSPPQKGTPTDARREAG